MPERRSDYSNRELEHYFTDFTDKLDSILVQTTKTNGRVGSLEMSRTQIWTAIFVVLLLGSVIMTLAATIGKSMLKDIAISAVEGKYDKQIEYDN